MKKCLRIVLSLFLIYLLLITVSLRGNGFRYPEDRNEANITEYLIEEPKGDSLKCKLLGGWFNGPDYAVFLKDSLVFIGDGGYVKILNIRDPSNPVLLGKIRVPSIFTGIYVVDTLAYVADYLDGLRIINVSNPTSPVEIGYYDTGDLAAWVYVKDSLAYVADYYDGLRIINVSNPTSPVEMGYYDTGGLATCVYVKDSLAYVADYFDGLYIIHYTGNSGIDNQPGDVNITIMNISNELIVEYSLKQISNVKIDIYNILGQKLSSPVNKIQAPGRYRVRWDGKTGIYFISYSIGTHNQVKKVTILK